MYNDDGPFRAAGEKLLDDIQYAGVAAYLAEAEIGNVNLFI
ncbi:hypothetical protein BsIDN1_03700 [Bacillus safensis]|uniref:Uncharacterized protein n=1 Tax=Bacillus safensis TaxID=561879 RepID=A0A5S9M208_BACIA|nr:hypothetical protein BsIDN1_03700 [Bacillus safensis]